MFNQLEIRQGLLIPRDNKQRDGLSYNITSLTLLEKTPLPSRGTLTDFVQI